MSQNYFAARRDAFATILAIAAIGLVAVALAALAFMFASEGRRTASIKSDAQVRQVLLAGAADAADRSRQWGDAAPTRGWSIQLPEELAHDGVRLTAQVRSAPAPLAVPATSPSSLPSIAPSVLIELTASEGRRLGHQELEFQRVAARWQLVSARLMP